MSEQSAGITPRELIVVVKPAQILKLHLAYPQRRQQPKATPSAPF